MSNHLDTVYFGAAIERTPDVLALQEQICTEHRLVPRGELHLTLGFVGKLTQDVWSGFDRTYSTRSSPPQAAGSESKIVSESVHGCPHGLRNETWRSPYM